MRGKADYVAKKYGPLLDKGLRQALAHRLQREFPRIGGPRILDLCAEMILEVVGEHIRDQETLRSGQILWLAVSVGDPPARGKRLKDTDLVPVVLDLCAVEDIRGILQRRPPRERLLKRLQRMCLQAYRQKGLLSNCDLAVLLSKSDSEVAKLIAEHERRSGRLLPRRATVHDVGTGLTHKRMICWKRYAQGKSTGEIARETYHSPEAVDRYLAQFDRVRNCRKQGLSPQKTAFMLNCGLSLVREYLAIDQAVEEHRGGAPHGREPPPAGPGAKLQAPEETEAGSAGEQPAEGQSGGDSLRR